MTLVLATAVKNLNSAVDNSLLHITDTLDKAKA